MNTEDLDLAADAGRVWRPSSSANGFCASADNDFEMLAAAAQPSALSAPFVHHPLGIPLSALPLSVSTSQYPHTGRRSRRRRSI